MSLKSLTNYWSSKSIKLSDAFEVLIQYSPTSQFETMVNCTGFTLPKLEYDEETYEYGNVAQVFVLPKYDSCKEVTLEFYETMKDKNFSVTTSKIFDYMGYKLNQKFDNWLSVNSANYTIDKYISTIDIKVLDNKLWRYIYKYHFDNLKIVNYSIYNLDYQSDTPCTISITFSFESYKKEIINETIDYTKDITPIVEPVNDELVKEEPLEELTDEENFRKKLEDEFKSESEKWENGSDKNHRLKGKKDQVEQGQATMSYVNDKLAELAASGKSEEDFESAKQDIIASFEDADITDYRKKEALKAFEEGKQKIQSMEGYLKEQTLFENSVATGDNSEQYPSENWLKEEDDARMAAAYKQKQLARRNVMSRGKEPDISTPVAYEAGQPHQ